MIPRSCIYRCLYYASIVLTIKELHNKLQAGMSSWCIQAITLIIVYVMQDVRHVTKKKKKKLACHSCWLANFHAPWLSKRDSFFFSLSKCAGNISGNRIWYWTRVQRNISWSCSFLVTSIYSVYIGRGRIHHADDMIDKLLLIYTIDVHFFYHSLMLEKEMLGGFGEQRWEIRGVR